MQNTFILYFIVETILTGIRMIRFSQLSAMGLKSRGGKDISAAIYFGTFANNQYCEGQASNRQYATAPQGINAVCIFLYLASDVSTR
jgi:hypothetical protein